MKLCFFADAAHSNTLNWAVYFANRLNHEVHVVSFRKPIQPTKNVTFHLIQAPYLLSKLRYFVCLPYAKRILTKINPDILVGYRITSYGFMAACMGFQPLVLAAQGSFIVHPSHNHLTYFAKNAIRRAKLIHAWGEHMTQNLIKLGANPKSILTLPRGVRTDIFKPQEFSDNSSLTLISTRGLNSDYNHSTILCSLKYIISEIPNTRYLIIGDGPARKNLEKLALHLGIHKYIEFLCSVNYEEIPIYLRSADIYVSAVPTDGVSSSLLEAMACGVFPVVVDNISNRPWIVNGSNGFLVPHSDSRFFARKIIEAFNNKEMRQYARQKNVRIIREKACWETNMARIEHIYRKLIMQGQK